MLDTSTDRVGFSRIDSQGRITHLGLYPEVIQILEKDSWDLCDTNLIQCYLMQKFIETELYGRDIPGYGKAYKMAREAMTCSDSKHFQDYKQSVWATFFGERFREFIKRWEKLTCFNKLQTIERELYSDSTHPLVLEMCHIQEEVKHAISVYFLYSHTLVCNLKNRFGGILPP